MAFAGLFRVYLCIFKIATAPQKLGIPFESLYRQTDFSIQVNIYITNDTLYEFFEQQQHVSTSAFSNLAAAIELSMKNGQQQQHQQH